MIKEIFIFLSAVLLFAVPSAQTADRVVVVPLGSSSDLSSDWKGDWTTDTYYESGTFVQFNGSSYVCTTGHTSSNPDDPGSSPSLWSLMVAKGDTGPQGEIGPSKFDACKDLLGIPGIIINDVCLLSYDNTLSSTWAAATTACGLKGGDLCSVSQYHILRANEPDIFAPERPVWSNDFSDNDASTKAVALHSSDDASSSLLYSYGCCGTLQAEPYHSLAQSINGIPVNWIQPNQDTTFLAAATICASIGTDLCTKSQYAALALPILAGKQVYTNEMSDNDANYFNSIIGNAADNTTSTLLYAFACCGSARPLDYSCNNGTMVNGICVKSIHDTEDTLFIAAAQSCAALEADICSKSQMQVIRDSGSFASSCWTSDGADNDSRRVGGLTSEQPDNPNPLVDLMGYACCQ